MKRRLHNIVAAISLLLCVATCVLWGRSYLVMDIVNLTREWPTHDGDEVYSGRWQTIDFENTAVVSNRGMILFERFDNSGVERAPDEKSKAGLKWDRAAAEENGYTMLVRGENSSWDSVGIHPWHFPADATAGRFNTSTGIMLPIWMFLLPTGGMSAWYFIRQHRNRRPQGLARCCPTCGYDLRASPARCPECGSVPKENFISN